MIVLPEISPYIFQIDIPHLGTVGPTWYGFMYVIGFVLGFHWAKHRIKSLPSWSEEQISDLLTYSVLGVILGGRIGYVLFYNFDYFVDNPLYLLKINEGGMSFHGGLLGVIIAIFFFSRKHHKGWVDVGDFVAPIFPIGLFFGRIGNFINAELWGKPTDSVWGVVFPHAGGIARHPSQLYEAALEGLVLFIIINWVARKPQGRGVLSGIFLLGYGVSRFVVEFVRLPDAHIGYIAFDWLTKGQLLSIPMVLAGILFIIWGRKQQSAA